uniref:Uncharacterized protein n=1 Tax=Anguilla anguilla TaxID=7936 RepID=A0A0E9TGR5_ANGAN
MSHVPKMQYSMSKRDHCLVVPSGK